MKVKNQSDQLINSNSNSNNNNNNVNSFASLSSLSAQMNSLNDTDIPTATPLGSSISPSFSNNTILTRSAAKLQMNSQKNRCTTQHAIGKIVKPIPVRPVSSSSSTHSSTFSSHHHNNNNSNQNTSLIKLIKSSANDSNDSNFSLIAKYFASFPATRLKSTHHHSNIIHPVESSCHSSSQSQSPIMPVLHDSKSTPFLPFKKHQQQQYPSLQSSSVLHTNVDLKPFDLQIKSTDHLCTNFKRMIKLNDLSDEYNFSPASPQTARSSNTPISLLDNEIDHSNDSIDQFDSRFGQITMETRSTRKFLIKHHPYLKSYNTQLLNTSPSHRPSINLLKMKKSNSTDTPPLVKTTTTGKNLKKQKSKQKLTENEVNTEEIDYDLYGDDLDYYDYYANNLNNGAELNNSKDFEDCKEEDSSGYYSSYHSVDLISTSGGSSGGDNLRQSIKTNPKSHVNTTNTTNSSTNTDQASKVTPHHHYQLRSNSTNPNPSVTSNTSTNNNNNNTKHINMPITRLRYQQQLAAASNTSSSNTNSAGQSCDLDLDQIEND